jgi:hypothetical protein
MVDFYFESIFDGWFLLREYLMEGKEYFMGGKEYLMEGKEYFDSFFQSYLPIFIQDHALKTLLMYDSFFLKAR